jgi:hypothetical protein
LSGNISYLHSNVTLTKECQTIDGESKWRSGCELGQVERWSGVKTPTQWLHYARGVQDNTDVASRRQHSGCTTHTQCKTTLTWRQDANTVAALRTRSARQHCRGVKTPTHWLHYAHAVHDTTDVASRRQLPGSSSLTVCKTTLTWRQDANTVAALSTRSARQH